MALEGIDPVLRSYSAMYTNWQHRQMLENKLITSTLIWKRLLIEYHMKSLYTSWSIQVLLTLLTLLTCISSDWKYVSSDVPQGSIIGPILFLIYTNDIGSKLSRKILLPFYTDDAKCSSVIRGQLDRDILQQDLSTLHQYKWSET